MIWEVKVEGIGWGRGDLFGKGEVKAIGSRGEKRVLVDTEGRRVAGMRFSGTEEVKR